MKRVRTFVAFLYDFIVGDDPRIALSVAVAFGATAALTAAGINAWWLLPPAAFAALAGSLARATKREAGPPSTTAPESHAAAMSGPPSHTPANGAHPRAARSSP